MPWKAATPPLAARTKRTRGVATVRRTTNQPTNQPHKRDKSMDYIAESHRWKADSVREREGVHFDKHKPRL